MKRLDLHWQIFIGLVLGIFFGLFFPTEITYVSWFGDLFMRGLKMIIVPLVVTSIISGVTNIGSAQNLGRLGLKTISYYIITSLFAILTGLLAVNILKPGVNAELGFAEKVEGFSDSTASFGETMINIIPTNFFEALVRADMLSIIMFSLLFGYFITKVDHKSNTFLTTLFNSSFEVMMKMTMFIIKLTPIGIFAIVAKVVVDNSGNLKMLAGSLGSYMVCVLIGLIVHFFITLPLFIKFIGKANPWLHFKAMRSALLTAFSTSSSAATLSLSMDCVQNKCGVSNKISSFTLPLGATINMDGTALYECVAAMFIAQAYGIELSIGQQMLVVMTALFASIGAAAIPMAGLVMMTIILTAVGLPLEGVGLIIAVDRFLDMFRTATNVWSDSCGAVIIAKSEGEILSV